MPESGPMVEAREARIGKQIVLPISKAIEISLKSLRIRFGRSMITMSGIILAIAFLTFVWTTNVIQERVRTLPESVPDYERLERIMVKQGLTSERTAEGLAPEHIWIICLALVICVVGIVNSMLMAVTERVREIGTMKCLGALNSFIVKLFMLESSFQGVAGTLVGIFLGGLLALLWSLSSFGSFAITYFPVVGVVRVLLLTLLVGTALSVFAAIFPAYRAARMQPVDAMRVEE